jgi:hypothetical protein
MKKRTAMLAIALALLVGGWAGWLAHQHNVRSQSSDPFVIANNYVAANFAPDAFRPEGTFLSYHIEEHGDAWTVELGPQGYIGGGLHLLIRRRDGKVLSAQRTQ